VATRRPLPGVDIDAVPIEGVGVLVQPQWRDVLIEIFRFGRVTVFVRMPILTFDDDAPAVGEPGIRKEEKDIRLFSPDVPTVDPQLVVLNGIVVFGTVSSNTFYVIVG
jgi:hypothetical protein